jgi:hypothetical protein
MVFEFEKKVEVDASRNEVWYTLRDDLKKFSECLDKVDNIEVISTNNKSDDIMEITNEWELHVPLIPEIIKSFIKDSYLKYTDTAVWSDSEKICTYTCAPSDDSESYIVYGEHKFIEINENKSEFHMKLRIEVDLAKTIPTANDWLPSWMTQNFVTDKILEKVEAFLLNSIADSVEDMVDTIPAFIEQKNSDI